MAITLAQIGIKPKTKAAKQHCELALPIKSKLAKTLLK